MNKRLVGQAAMDAAYWKWRHGYEPAWLAKKCRLWMQLYGGDRWFGSRASVRDVADALGILGLIDHNGSVKTMACANWMWVTQPYSERDEEAKLLAAELNMRLVGLGGAGPWHPETRIYRYVGKWHCPRSDFEAGGEA